MAIIRVKAKSAIGFRRSGKAFTAEFCEPFEADAKTLAVLKGEKMLIVEEVEEEKDKKKKDK
jgi:hypothetical protein